MSFVLRAAFFLSPLMSLSACLSSNVDEEPEIIGVGCNANVVHCYRQTSGRIGDAGVDPLTGTAAVTQARWLGSQVTTRSNPTHTVGGQPAWADAFAYSSTSVEAVVADAGTTLEAGIRIPELDFIDGTPTQLPNSGSATFSGHYGVLYADPVTTVTSAQDGTITLLADFSNASVTSISSPLNVAGTIDNAAVNGTVTFNGQSADMFGGFTGDEELVTAFEGDNIAGIIFTTED